MHFGQPQYLWGLLALAVPVAIHLWSKHEGKVVKIGSIELLQQVDSKQTRTIRLNEILLLFMRCLLIAILVMVLAGPELTVKEAGNNNMVYLVERGLLVNKVLRPMVDSLDENTVRLFEKGFPLYQKKRAYKKNVIPDYWQLAGDLTSIPADSLVIFTTARFAGITGRRPVIRKGVHWIILNEASTKEMAVHAYNYDSVTVVHTATSGTLNLSFKKEVVAQDSLQQFEVNKGQIRTDKDSPWIEIRNVPPLKVKIAFDNDYVADEKFVRAALASIGKYVPMQMKISSVKTVDYKAQNEDVVVWLSDQDFDKDIQAKLFYARPDTLANALIQKTGTEQFMITSHLNIQNTVEQHFSEQLMNALGLLVFKEEMVTQADIRSLPFEYFKPDMVKKELVPGEKDRDISYLWWSVLLFTLIGERSIAWLRKQ